MKLRKILSVCTSLVLLLVICSKAGRAYAASNVIDFEDGKVPEGIFMATLEDGSPDGDPSILSVVDYNGSKMLKIDTQENGTPKVKFDMPTLVGADAFTKVRTIEYDIIIEQPSGDVAGWNGGTVGATPTGASGWTNGTEWTIEEYNNSATAVKTLKHTLTDDLAFTDSSKAFFMFMNWANNGTDIYLDNIKFYDADGNLVPLAGAAADTATAEATAETAETATTPKTGVESYAVLYLIGSALMASGIVATKKHKNEK